MKTQRKSDKREKDNWIVDMEGIANFVGFSGVRRYERDSRFVREGWDIGDRKDNIG